MKYETYIEEIGNTKTIKDLMRICNRIGNDDDIPLGDKQDSLMDIINMRYRYIINKEKAERGEKANRIELLKAMHLIMASMNDEDAYTDWSLVGVPDQPSDDDFDFMASDDNFNECFDWFVRILNQYKADGLMW